MSITPAANHTGGIPPTPPGPQAQPEPQAQPGPPAQPVTVFRLVRHIGRCYRTFFAVLLAVSAALLVAIAVTLQTFGNWPSDGGPASVWHLAGTQMSVWMLFVIGILLATINLPMAIMYGIPRSMCWRAAAIIVTLTGLVFTTLLLLGYGVEYLIYQAHGVTSQASEPYPVSSFADAATVAGSMFLGYLGYASAGWLIGMIFYRLNVFLGIGLSIIITIVTGGGEGFRVGSSDLLDSLWPASPAISLLLIATVVGAGYWLSRDVPVRPKKA